MTRNDPDRLAALRSLLVLDSERETAYDEFAGRLAASLDVPITIINMLDAERDWFKACVGLPQTESAAATSFCEVFFDDGADLLVVDDTRRDARFAGHPFVAGDPFIRFYAGARLSVNGQTVGTLCAYDVKPRTLTASQVDHMRALAQAVIETLLARRAARQA